MESITITTSETLRCRRCQKSRPTAGKGMCASCLVGFYVQRKQGDGSLTVEAYIIKYPTRVMKTRSDSYASATKPIPETRKLKCGRCQKERRFTSVGLCEPCREAFYVRKRENGGSLTVENFIARYPARKAKTALESIAPQAIAIAEPALEPAPNKVTCPRCQKEKKLSSVSGLCGSCHQGWTDKKYQFQGNLTVEQFIERFPPGYGNPKPKAWNPVTITAPRAASVIPLGTTQELIPGFFYAGAQMQQLANIVKKLAGKKATILILGETGSGKELIARALHGLGPRQKKPFKVVDCTILTHDLAASELFGHVQGAFTTATKTKYGIFALANHGTIFLDELSTLPLDIQPKLLRILEEGEYRPVGASEYSPVDARIIGATNQSLEEMVRRGQFRADLFYRLNVFSLRVPPLRERKDEIPLLVRWLLERMQEEPVEVTNEALGILVNHAWPGNIRELKNVLTRALLLRDDDHDPIAAKDLPGEIFHAGLSSVSAGS